MEGVRLRVEPGAALGGATKVPGDKSIAHRWLILAATASGRSVLRGLPDGFDVRSTAACLGALSRSDPLEAWASEPSDQLVVEGGGRGGLAAPATPLFCGNSGTTMRMLAGVLAGCAFASELSGDGSLSRRPMERVAEPLRLMGADIGTKDGHAPLTIRGGALRGIRYELPVPSAQVKSAILFAGLSADGSTIIVEPAAGRNHTEVALTALGAPLEVDGNVITIRPFQHGGFEGDVPGDPSSAAFVIGAAAVTRSKVAVRDVGLNPSRTAFVNVMRRMGVRVGEQERWESLGEPAGVLEVDGGGTLRGVTVTAAELPLVIDEVPVLAAIATHAEGVSRFEGAGELRLKESDRLAGIANGVAAMGGDARIEGDTLIVGGGGLAGGSASASGDHRIAMALAVAALGARGDCFIEGMEWAAISFPGFVDALVSLGAHAETT